jgi:two-component system sensor histidine kinase RegB
MWFTFTLSTCLITFFVVKMAHALRQQDQEKTINRENELRDEQILAIATLAAGTAHELGTPLATMTVLLDEMEFEFQKKPEVISDVHLLNQQVTNCKHILQGLVSTAESHSNGHHQTKTVNIVEYLQEVLTHWQVIRPTAQYTFTYSDNSHHKTLQLDLTLKQAIINILNNAADACPDNIEVKLSCHNDTIVIRIRDHGAGIPQDIADQMGKPFISTKRQGLGLGLFLSHATINRYGGKIELHNCSDGGTLAEIEIPDHYQA